ncbi:hypothetical protein ABEB36_000494 [Hypothenemus hampei]|uniref:PROP1-like PPR domain-containing protein n=1 Tax=Hypothenemus hampei TaxID=57062 RepID=A0ABD1FBE0_HYPHA
MFIIQKSLPSSPISTHVPSCLASNKVLHENYSETPSKPSNFHRKTLNQTLWNTPTSISNSIETEHTFLIKAKLNPDNFGDGVLDSELLNEDDLQNEQFRSENPAPHQKLSTKKYADIIKGFIRQRKIKEAIDVLEIRMLQEDRVKPESYIYSLLLGACGRVGYTKKAFMLYNDMKKRGLKVHPGAYTALFNACSNSPWPTTDGLTRAKHLYNIMIEKNYQPNETNYNAMIKAFGRCGELSMAFSLVDKMEKEGFRIKADTFAFLFQTCISDKEAGFRHCLLVWRKLIEKHIPPSIFTFNLMLRCVRECGLGNLEITTDVIGKLIGENKRTISLENSKEVKLLEEPNDALIKAENFDMRPNLLAVKPHLGGILSISEVKQPEDRLLLIGGCKGLLETMNHYKCTPDIKTFTLLLDSIPSTQAAEKELIVAMKKLNVKPDVDFYNMLIKKRSMRFDYEGAKEVLDTMKQLKYRPNVMTYGILALGCQTKEEALELINQMKLARYTLNSVILGAMLKQACCHMRFDYIFEIMEVCLSESVPVNQKFLDHLTDFKRKCKAKRDAKELTKKETQKYSVFKERLKTWLENVQKDDSEDAHPWQQYRQTYPDDVKFKCKDTARFKPRHASLFRVKTSKKHLK